jgi:hypothetical protein
MLRIGYARSEGRVGAEVAETARLILVANPHPGSL